jgi:hypothetical protein
MIRTVLPSVLLFLLPFVLYFLWLGFQRRKMVQEAIATRRHFFWVGLMGVVLAVTGFVFFTDFGGAPPGSLYIPPTYKDGTLVPGHFAPRETK